MVKSKKFILSGLICFAFALCCMFGAMSFNSSKTAYATDTEEHGFIVTKTDGEAVGVEWDGTEPELDGFDYYWDDSDHLWILTDDLIVSGQGLEGEEIHVGKTGAGYNPESITFNNLKTQDKIIVYSDMGSTDFNFTITIKGENQIGTATNRPDFGLSFLYSNLTITGDGNLTIYDEIEGILAGELNANPRKDLNLKFDEEFTGNLVVLDEGADLEESDPEPPICAISIGSGTLTVENGTLVLVSKKKNAITADSISIDENLVVYSGDDHGLEKNADTTNKNIAYITPYTPHTETIGESQQVFMPWVSDSSLPTAAGNWFLTTDVTLPETWTVPQGEYDEPVKVTNLCLNGYVIKFAGETGSVINVPQYATLNLYDCDTTTSHDGYVDSTGLWHLDATNAHNGQNDEKDITGGIITGGNTATNGGGVNVSGTFTMFGGTICGNTALSGGGIFVNGTFNMEGGNIVGNTATTNGGGVSNIKSFTMTGGNILGNYAGENGGGVYASSVTFVNILTGGTITDNTAPNGGGVYYKVEECFAPGTLITMADGTRRAIETLNIGDSVRVFDHEEGKVSTSKIFDVWTYPEKHSGQVKLYFSNDIDVTVVYGHSFFEREQNKYVAVTRDNVSAFVGHEFYNVDSNCWEKLEGYEFIDGEVDTYVITTEYQLSCVASGMLTNEDGFYTMITNIFDYGDDLKIDESKKTSDIDQYGIYGFENLKYMSRETYDKLNFQYLNVAIGKGMITTEEISYLGAYWSNVDSELFCDEKEETPVESKSILLKAPLKAPLLTSSVPAPTAGFYVGGSIKILGNNGGNLYISSGKRITIGTGTVGSGKGVIVPAEDMQIGITLEDSTGQFTDKGITGDYSANFFSDNANYGVYFDNAGTETAEDDFLALGYAITNACPKDDDDVDCYITLSKSVANSEETITFNVTVGTGYKLKADSIKAIYNDGEKDVELELIGENNAYTFTMPAYAVTVTATFEEKQEIVITETQTTRTYNGNEQAFQIQNGEGESAMLVFTMTYYKSGDWTTPVTPINAGSYNVRITRSEDDTYKAYEKELENGLVIERKDITLTIVDIATGTYIYDGTAKTTTATYTDLVGDDKLSYTLAYSDNINAGTCTVSIESATITEGTATNYNIITSDTGTLVIDKVPLTITAKDKTIKYNQDPANDGVSYDGFVNNETSAVLSGTLAFEYSYEKGNNAGEYTITPSGLTSNNYDISFVNGKLTVEKIEQEIVINDISKTYDKSPIILWDSSYTKLGDGEVTVKYKLATEEDDKYTTTAPTNAGSYVVRVSVAEGTNYLAGSQTRNFEISYYYINQVGFGNIKQPIATQTAPTTSGGMLVDIKYLETLTWSPTLVDGKFDYNTIYTATVVLEIKDKTNHRFAEEITLKGAGTGWTKSTDSTDTKLIYTKEFEKTGKIPQTVEITNDISKTYNGEIVSTPTYTKLGDGTVTVEYKLASEEDTAYTATAPTNAGSYVVRVSIAETETHLSGFETAEFTINKAQVNVPTANNNLIYGGTEQTGVELPQNALFTLEHNTSTIAGYFTAIATLNDKANYEWKLDTPTSDNQEIEWSIAKRELIVTIANQTSVYGDEIVELTATCDNLATGDSASDLFRLETDATKTSDVGEYLIWATQSNNTNYNITFVGTRTDITEYSTYRITQREVTLTWGETTFAYNNQQKLPTVVAGNLANDDNVTVTVVPNKENINAGNDYVATATALSNNNYKLPETNLTTNFVINKIDYDMSGVTFNDKTVKTTDNNEDKKMAISGTLPTGLDGIQVTVSYENNDNTTRGIYEVTAHFATTSVNYNVPSDMTATLTILWVRDAKTIGTDDETVIITSEQGIDPTYWLNVEVVELDKQNTQYKEVKENIKQEETYNSYLDRIFAVYDVTLLDQNDIEVQPDGTIKVYMQIPELIKDCEFRIYHIHDGVPTKVDYETIDGYAVITTDVLSEFVFVYEQTSLLVWIIVLSIISLLGLVALAYQIIKHKKDNNKDENISKKQNKNNAKKLAAAAPIFYIPGHLEAVIALAVVAGVLLIANSILFLIDKKKNNKKIVLTQGMLEVAQAQVNANQDTFEQETVKPIISVKEPDINKLETEKKTSTSKSSKTVSKGAKTTTKETTVKDTKTTVKKSTKNK